MTAFLQRLDETILLWIHQDWRSGLGDAFFPWMTESEHFLIPLAVFWLGMIAFGGRTGRAMALLLAVGLVLTDQISSHLIKPWVGRERPCFVVEGVEALIQQVRSRSFPSSHASNMFGAATIFATVKGRWWNLSFVVAAAVGLSRIYVGVHYPSDVAAGALLGIACGGALCWIARRIGLLKRPAAVVTAVLIGAVLAGCGGADDPSPPAVEATVPIPDPSPFVTCVDTVRRGDTFSGILLRNHLYLSDIERVIAETRRRELFSLRRLRPGETIALELDLHGSLQRLEYQKSPDRIFVFEACGDSLQLHQTGLAYETYLRKVRGVVETTVDEALRSGGANAAVVLDLATILSSHVDFLTEPRGGDEITLLIEEKRYMGERVGLGPIHFATYRGRRGHHVAVRFAGEGNARYFTPAGESMQRTFLRSPLNYRRISSRFTHRRFHPILRTWRPHLGVDYAAPPGTPVVAIGDGVVTFAAWNGGFGRQVRLRHDATYHSCYGHLSRFAKGITRGTRVARGQVIGYVGSTGLSTGPHLDFRVRRHGAYIDPLRMENPPDDPVAPDQMTAFLDRVGLLEAMADSLAPGEMIRWGGRRRWEPRADRKGVELAGEAGGS